MSCTGRVSPSTAGEPQVQANAALCVARRRRHLDCSPVLHVQAKRSRQDRTNGYSQSTASAMDEDRQWRLAGRILELSVFDIGSETSEKQLSGKGLVDRLADLPQTI